VNALISGVSLEAKQILTSALNIAFGDGVVELVELNKDNLRQRVHLSTKGNGAVETVLVVLDSVSLDVCKDMQGRLEDSNKFHLFSNEVSLVEFLNYKYNLSLEYKEDDLNVEAEDVSEYIEKIDRLERRLLDKEDIIENLTCQVKEYESYLECETVSCSNIDDTVVEELKAEVLRLKSNTSDINSEHYQKLEILENERDSLKISLQNLEKSKESLLVDYSSISAELKDFQVKYSTQSGLLKSKEREISTLKNEILELSSKIENLNCDASRFLGLKEQIVNLTRDLEVKTAELLNKESEVKSLENQLSTFSENNNQNSDLVNNLKAELVKSGEEKIRLETELITLKSELSSIDGYKNTIHCLEQDISTLKCNIAQLNEELEKSDRTILELNEEKIEMQSKLNVLEKSTSRDTDIEALMSDLNSIRMQYLALQEGTFSKISSLALPQGNLAIKLIQNSTGSYNNIRFVFAGSTESRKGLYKSVLAELKSNKDTNYLVVDVVSETSIDYVFEIEKVTPGMDWFRKGGGVQRYLSNTCAKNVSVLSPGIGYINDSYFLTIDWFTRLNELEESGYKVVVICGDISNMVGRILHESFADLGESSIYVHGNAIGSRSVITNIKGLSNASSSAIYYFEFNNKMQKLFDIASKTCSCHKISVL